MTDNLNQSRGVTWGPDAKSAAVSFTFDNLGEAAELELGIWPADKPVGDHYSAKRVVPELLERLPDIDVTFFIEGWNCEIYPDTVKSIAAAGHDVGLHGWRHEIWSKLGDEEQRAALRRGREAMRAIGVEPVGLRPPGGNASPRLAAMLREEGISYLSDVGVEADLDEGLVRLPFTWKGVDGVFLQPELGKAIGIEGIEGGLEGMVESHKQAIATAKKEGGYVAFVFHPFLLGEDPARMDALLHLIEYATSDDDVWVAPCAQIARWMRQRGSGAEVASSVHH
jgi:peptidoglycan/xylan/chitin deacetylase (PgdA/CDA1 family)